MILRGTAPQTTLRRPCVLGGRGYWSGRAVDVQILPAPADSGYRLRRVDLPGRPIVDATIGHRVDAALRTNLRTPAASFQMVEHVLSALAGMGVDNALVEINAEELPGLDGGAGAYADAIATAGTRNQDAPARLLVITETFVIRDGNATMRVDPPRGRETYHEFQLAYDSETDTPIAPQAFGMEIGPESYRRQIAPARTFITHGDADAIRARGLAGHVTESDLLIIDEDGTPMNNHFRFINELARHKTLDMIGDLALAGIRVAGRFTSHRGGHALNGRTARRIAELAVSTLARDGRSSYTKVDRDAATRRAA